MADDALVDALSRKLAEDGGSPGHAHVFRWTARAAVAFLTDEARGDARLVPATTCLICGTKFCEPDLDSRCPVCKARAERDALFAELATILGPGKPPKGVTRAAYWIARVGQALGAVEAERDAYREDLHNLRESYAHVVKARAALLAERDAARAERDALRAENERLKAEKRNAIQLAQEVAWAMERDRVLDDLTAKVEEEFAAPDWEWVRQTVLGLIGQARGD